MADVMLQTIPSFYTKVSEKSLFISSNTYEEYILCKDYCVAHHSDKSVFYPFVTIILYYMGRATKEVGYILLHLSTRGLSVYTVQVPI